VAPHAASVDSAAAANQNKIGTILLASTTMPSTARPNAALDPGFFDGRILLEITSWDCTYHLMPSPRGLPKEHRFQGGLSFSHGFELETRVVVPKGYPVDGFRLWLSTFDTEAKFGPKHRQSLGQLVIQDASGVNAPRIGTLYIPEATLATVATCLASVWKYLHVWTFDEDDDGASVSAFCFSRDIHQNLSAWVYGEI
jgi:hypothetical protein